MYYKTVKTSLSVLKIRSKYDDITHAVDRMDQIMTRAWMFLKLYLLHHNDKIKQVELENRTKVFAKEIEEEVDETKSTKCQFDQLREELVILRN